MSLKPSRRRAAVVWRRCRRVLRKIFGSKRNGKPWKRMFCTTSKTRTRQRRRRMKKKTRKTNCARLANYSVRYEKRQVRTVRGYPRTRPHARRPPSVANRPETCCRRRRRTKVWHILSSSTVTCPACWPLRFSRLFLTQSSKISICFRVNSRLHDLRVPAITRVTNTAD